MNKTVSVSEFINVVANSNAATIKLELNCPVTMNKKGNTLYYSDARKVINGIFVFGSSYGDLVNQFAGIDSFKSKPLQWGQYVDGSNYKVITHNNKYYLRYYNAVTTPNIVYKVDGHTATPAECQTISQFAKKSYMPKTQEAVGLNENCYVHAQSVCFDNIVMATIGGINYTIK